MADKPLDAVIADLTRETASWQTLTARIFLEQTLYAPIGPSPAGTVTQGRETYVASHTGERRYGQYSLVDDVEACVLLACDDLKSSALVRYLPPPHQLRQKSITISKDFLNESQTGFAAIPTPLPFYVGLQPIRTAISSASVIGPSQVAGHECTRYLFAKVPGNGSTQDLVYHLDTSTSYPLKVESFADSAQVAAETPFSVWEADRLDEVRQWHVATDSRFTTFAPTSAGGIIPQLVNKYHFDSIRFNTAVPASAFWPRYDPGVLINNTITGQMSYNTFDGKAPQAATAADPNALPWTSWAVTGGITVGLALLVVGLARWIKGSPDASA